MSTSIAANIGPRASGPESLAPSHPPVQQHEEEAKKGNPSPAEAIAFTTPVIKVDNNTGLALLVVRDGATGEELDQYPSKKVVEEYQRVQGSSPAPTSSPDPSSSSAPADGGAALSSGAVVPPAPVAAPPVSPATGDARTTTTLSGSSGVKPVTN